MNKSKNQAKQVIVPSREVKILTCPYCWTDQRTERDFCYRCGAGFIYLDEVKGFNRTPLCNLI